MDYVLNEHNKSEHKPSHTAEHIINRTMDNVFHCGRAFEAHIERKKSKMDFRLDVAPSPEQMKSVESMVNEVIGRGLDVSFSFITQEEAASRYDLRRLPDGASNTVRVVSIGDYDDCLCVGQHVANTREIGLVSFVSFDFNADSKTLRIRFKVIEPQV